MGAADDPMSRYRRIAVIGEGNFGTVWEAEDTLLGRRVAIKELHGDAAGGGAADGASDTPRDRLLREARLLAKVAHRGFTQVLDLLPDAEHPSLVLELVHGLTLSQRLSSGPLPLGEALAAVEGVSDVLHAVHRAGLVHRDVRPDNVVFHPVEGVKLLDLGLACAADEMAERWRPSVLPDHAPAAYEPPERRNDLEPPSANSDVFAVGVLLHKLLTGKIPDTGQVGGRWRQPRPLRELRPELPESVESLVRELLAEYPAQRPGSAGELRRRVQRIQGELGGDGVDAAVYDAAAMHEAAERLAALDSDRAGTKSLLSGPGWSGWLYSLAQDPAVGAAVFKRWTVPGSVVEPRAWNGHTFGEGQRADLVLDLPGSGTLVVRNALKSDYDTAAMDDIRRQADQDWGPTSAPDCRTDPVTFLQISATGRDRYERFDHWETATYADLADGLEAARPAFPVEQLEEADTRIAAARMIDVIARAADPGSLDAHYLPSADLTKAAQQCHLNEMAAKLRARYLERAILLADGDLERFLRREYSETAQAPRVYVHGLIPGKGTDPWPDRAADIIVQIEGDGLRVAVWRPMSPEEAAWGNQRNSPDLPAVQEAVDRYGDQAQWAYDVLVGFGRDDILHPWKPPTGAWRSASGRHRAYMQKKYRSWFVFAERRFRPEVTFRQTADAFVQLVKAVGYASM